MSRDAEHRPMIYFSWHNGFSFIFHLTFTRKEFCPWEIFQLQSRR